MKLFTKRTWVLERVKNRKAKEPADYAGAEQDFDRYVEQGIIYEVKRLGIAGEVPAYAKK